MADRDPSASGDTAKAEHTEVRAGFVVRQVRRAAARLRLAWWGMQEFRRMAASYGLVYSFRKVAQVLGRDGLRSISTRHQGLAEAEAARNARNSSGTALHAVPPASATFRPKVSVIVPNYNHAAYLRERLDSIYSQTYDNIEVILLDDASTDASREVLSEYAARYAANTRTAFNDSNSGGAFHQWQKGVEMAGGELVWIAESDDTCQPGQLAELVRFFQNEAVQLAFCRSDFVSADASRKVWSTEDFLNDTAVGDLDRAWVRSAHWLVNHGWGMKNIVPNVSSALFRHPGHLPLLRDPAWKALRLCGDWVFYLHVIRGGLVAYTPATVNYYRQHDAGTSITTQKQNTYYQEHETVARVLIENYRLDTPILEWQQRALHGHWCSNRKNATDAGFQALYDLGRARAAAAARTPNLLMAGYALSAGGGETFPIALANALHDAGLAVSFLNLRRAPTEPGVRNMLNRNVPLLGLDRIEDIDALCKDLGIDIIHSHHAWVDTTLAQHLSEQAGYRHLVTLHGMYEMMEKWELERLLPIMERAFDRMVYTAEKNLLPFSPAFQARKSFVHIPNALAAKPVQPVDRAPLGIKPEDFVFCLVSRAIPEKGWEEAIDALALAQATTNRRLHLLLIGEGAEYDRLRARSGPTVHFLGFKPNIRDYFAMADMALLPSRYKGESYPLVLIDSLMAGRPVIASNVGDIAVMLKGDNGPAGALFELEGGQIPVATLAALMHRMATDPAAYQPALQAVESAALKFDPAVMAQRYIEVYDALMPPQPEQTPQTEQTTKTQP